MQIVKFKKVDYNVIYCTAFNLKFIKDARQ